MTKPQVDKDGAGAAIIPRHLILLARRIKSTREVRADLFDPILFGEPAWNMLLALYVAAGEGYQLSVSALCVESGSPPSTAMRWIERLIERKIVRRIRNPADHRSSYVELTFDNLAKMTSLLESAHANIVTVSTAR